VSSCESHRGVRGANLRTHDRSLTATGALAVTLGGCLLVGALAVGEILTPPAADIAFVLLATGVGLVATWPGVLLGAGLAFTFTNGFLHGSYGALTWHGRDDFVRLCIVFGLAVLASILGHALRRRHPHYLHKEANIDG